MKVSLVCVECGATFTNRMTKARHVAKCAPKGTKETTPLRVVENGSSMRDGSTVGFSNQRSCDSDSVAITEQIARVLPDEEKIKTPAPFSVEEKKVSACATCAMAKMPARF
jgi:hypothetical protein